jgi:serine/threonine-protein kinase
VSPQRTIAHYRITAKLGEGGMGEVWRATDTKLSREVAVKVLPESFAADPDRLARFAREAQVLASLNHPNIAQIYGVEDRALIMELVDGPTLAERIAQRPIPFDEALDIARQIADALEAAHEKGIVHRDLKPANIKLTADGRVKVLDFGLAKALAGETSSAKFDSSGTLTMHSTMAGIVLGTAGYMAPEQAKGKSVDKRADIWAFGVVLYEMIAGCRLFDGESVSDRLAAILTKEPEWERVPAELRRPLRACLERDPKRRLRDVGDVWRFMEAEPPAAPRHSWRMGALAAALTIALAAVSAAWWRASRPVGYPLVRLNVDLGPQALPGFNLTAAISPDGRRLAFAARGADGRPQLATRVLDQPQATMLAGTEGAQDPFFSPDSRWIGFFDLNNAVKKISVDGGAPIALSPTWGSRPQGAHWGPDGNIVGSFGIVTPLLRLPDAGGTAQPITRLRAGELSHRWPQVLPGGRAILFTASSSATAQDDADIEVLSLQTGNVKLVHSRGYFGRYLPSGHLVYLNQGVLFGVRFDRSRLETQGTPVPLLEDVAANVASGGGQFDFSPAPFGHGTFVYAAGKGLTQTWSVEWLDSTGKTAPLLQARGVYAGVRFSPDGRRLAFQRDGRDIYVYDFERDTTTRLTFTGNAVTPVWAPDGRHIAYRSVSNGSVLLWIRSDGAGEPQRLFETRETAIPWSISPDGRHLAYMATGTDPGFDIWTLPLDLSDPDRPKAGAPEPFLRDPGNEYVPRFSPDGRWIAYRSNESGNDEVYVRPFGPAASSGSGGKWQISTGGGNYPIWSNNGRELFYESPENRIMVAAYSVEGGTFIPSRPQLWSEKRLFLVGGANMDLAPDGQRFAVLTVPEPAGSAGNPVHVTFLLNFFDELKRRIP